jgi:cytochrome c
MNKTLVLGLFLIIILAAAAVIQQQQAEKTQREAIISLVDQAVQQIQNKGEKVFPEFGSPAWYHGDIYVFVWRLDGIRVVYPPDPNGVGQNMTNLKDSTGKPIGKLFIQTAEKDGGWVEYLWPKPKTSIPSTKITYIQRAQYKNQTYLVGSGYYVE